MLKDAELVSRGRRSFCRKEADRNQNLRATLRSKGYFGIPNAGNCNRDCRIGHWFCFQLCIHRRQLRLALKPSLEDNHPNALRLKTRFPANVRGDKRDYGYMDTHVIGKHSVSVVLVYSYISLPSDYNCPLLCLFRLSLRLPSYCSVVALYLLSSALSVISWIAHIAETPTIAVCLSP